MNCAPSQPGERFIEIEVANAWLVNNKSTKETNRIFLIFSFIFCELLIKYVFVFFSAPMNDHHPIRFLPFGL